jgi:hypothetical protein
MQKELEIDNYEDENYELPADDEDDYGQEDEVYSDPNT